MSSVSQINWPSIGFATIVSTHTLLVALLWWGWQTPVLDKAQSILTQRELNAGFQLSVEDRQVLQDVWNRHPGFSRALLGKASARFVEPTELGWLARNAAHMAVRPDSDQPVKLSLEGRGIASDFPIIIKIHGSGFDRQVTLAAPNQPQQLDVSIADLKHASILELEMTSAHPRATGAQTWAIRLTSSSPNTARETP